MPLRFVLHIVLGKRTTCDDVVRAGAENDTLPDTDAIRAICKNSNELPIDSQRCLLRVAVHSHICYPIGPLGIKAGVDVDSRRGRPVGFVKEVRVFPVLMVEGDDTLGIDVLGITLVARGAAEVE